MTTRLRDTSALAAGALSGRVSAVRRKGTERVLLSQVVAVCVAAYGLLGWTARGLAGYGGPPNTSRRTSAVRR